MEERSTNRRRRGAVLVILLQLAYLTIGSWIGYICHYQTIDVLCDGKDPEPTDRLIAALVTFAAILGWIILLPISIAIRYTRKDR